jgi:hypothetical protein
VEELRTACKHLVVEAKTRDYFDDISIRLENNIKMNIYSKILKTRILFLVLWIESCMNKKTSSSTQIWETLIYELLE